MPYFESTNSSLLGKCALWNFDGNACPLLQFFFNIISQHFPSVHGYADDTQIYLSFRPCSIHSEINAVSVIEKCIADVRSWFIGNRLMINDAKTDFPIIGTRQQLEKTSIESIIIGDAVIKPLESVRNLGSWFNAHMLSLIHI